MFISDTVVRSNGLDGLRVVGSSSGTALINVDNSRFERNGDDGIHLDDKTIEASITNSIIMSENSDNGLQIDSDDGNTRANVAHSTGPITAMTASWWVAVARTN